MSKVLVVGASGLVGHAAVRRFAALPSWQVVGISRRTPAAVAEARFVSVDLLDAGACEQFIADEGADVTHLVYAALVERPGLVDGWFDDETIERNAAMLRNVFLPLERVANGLDHVSLLQGTKAYGIHHPDLADAPLHLPLRERDPRRPHPNFYFVQEDFLRARQVRSRWAMTILRPTVVYGDSPGSNMNPLLAIGVYCALERERGRWLDFPGDVYDVSATLEAVDSELVAEALTWAATAPGAKGGTFNVTNGDTFSWPSVWPSIAATFGMDVGQHRPTSLALSLPARNAEWVDLIRHHHLDVPDSIEEYVGANSLIYADWALSSGRSTAAALNSTIAGRRAGFAACLDTEDMFVQWFERLQDAHRLPTVSSSSAGRR